jgi:hypothetical protein
MPAVELGQSCAVLQEGSRHLPASKGKFENSSAQRIEERGVQDRDGNHKE